MASLTQTIEQQTKEITSEATQKRRKREAKERIKNIAYNIIYKEFYKQQETPELVYLKLNNIRERQKFIDDLPVIYKIKNDYITEQEASDIYTKELSRQFKVFKNNLKFIDQQDMKYLQEIEAEQIEEETTKQNKNFIITLFNIIKEILKIIAKIYYYMFKFVLYTLLIMFSICLGMIRPYKRR